MDQTLRENSLRVLLVEDDHLTRLLVQQLLQKEGYGVLAASSASQAWEMLLDGEECSLILSDVIMPEVLLMFMSKEDGGNERLWGSETFISICFFLTKQCT